MYIGYCDLGCFFMSCVREVQWEVEKWTGVDPGVTKVVQALHAEVSGRYETAWGLTERFGIHIGNGQGCVNGAVRSKLLLTVMQRMVDKHCEGIDMGGTGGIPLLFFADDAALLASSLAGLQLGYDCMWMVARACGLRMVVKKKSKTAYMAIHHHRWLHVR